MFMNPKDWRQCQKCNVFYHVGNNHECESSGYTNKSAIEHGIYLANAAERFIASVNNLDRVIDDEHTDQEDLEDAEQSRSECWTALESAIHEFNKRV